MSKTNFYVSKCLTYTALITTCVFLSTNAAHARCAYAGLSYSEGATICGCPVRSSNTVESPKLLCAKQAGAYIWQAEDDACFSIDFNTTGEDEENSADASVAARDYHLKVAALFCQGTPKPDLSAE